MTSMQRKISAPFEIKKLSNTGKFTGYGSVFFKKDYSGDVVVPGAFLDSLAQHKANKSNPALLLHHDHSRPCGVYDVLQEDQAGLYVEGRLLLETNDGKEAFELLKGKALNGLSIGYHIVDSEYDQKSKATILKKLDLWEISLVTFPANDSARVTGVKTAREFEGMLCNLGFSRNQARNIACVGFNQSEAELKEARVKLALRKNIELLRGKKYEY